MSEPVRIDDFASVRKALSHPALSRTLDRRSFAEGNPRAGILSVLHGDEHRHRRRFENPLFRRQALVDYERELFPGVLAGVLDQVAVGPADLFALAGSASVVLAARRAGVDHDGSARQLGELFEYVKVIAQAAAVHDVVGDRGRVQAEAVEVLRELDRSFVSPSRRRREDRLRAAAAGDADDEAPDDLLTVALRGLRAGDETMADHDLLVREVALFLHGGSHTSAQTACNAFSFLFGLDGGGPRSTWLRRVVESKLDAQKCVHETLRLVPTTPELKRHVEIDAEVVGTPVAQGGTVVLDARAANRDPKLFGEDPDAFNPDRSPAPGVALWGHAFGAGPHICIGRSVAGGLPLTAEVVRDGVGDGHLYGLIALMVQAVAARGVRPDPARAPERDQRTTRGSRWSRFPVLFPSGAQLR